MIARALWRRLDHRIPVPAYVLVLLILAAPVAVHVVASYRIGIDPQLTPSLPWRVALVDLRDQAVARGDLVAFRAIGIAVEVEGTTLHTDGTWLLKRVVGVPGDRVRVDGEGLHVNDLRVADDLVLAGTLGQPPAHWFREEVIAPGRLYVAGLHPASYDSRYFGPIASHQIIGRAWGIW
ncbi:MAG: S26 family signal peptidase [Actinomycetota bacterium]